MAVERQLEHTGDVFVVADCDGFGMASSCNLQDLRTRLSRAEPRVRPGLAIDGSACVGSNLLTSSCCCYATESSRSDAGCEEERAGWSVIALLGPWVLSVCVTLPWPSYISRETPTNCSSAPPSAGTQTGQRDAVRPPQRAFAASSRMLATSNRSMTRVARRWCRRIAVPSQHGVVTVASSFPWQRTGR